MAKLVVLSEGLSGRSHELKAEKTTVGRLEDNAFQIPDQSVSSHHCEITLRGSDVIVKDLNSTNGTFINGQQITEAVLKPGQAMRLGQVELRLEGEGTTAPSSQKALETARMTPRGVKLEDLDQTAKLTTFSKTSPFLKRTNKATKIFIIGAVVLGVIIVGLLVLILLRFGNLGP